MSEEPNLIDRARAKLVAAIENCPDDGLAPLAEKVRQAAGAFIPTWLAIDILIEAEKQRYELIDALKAVSFEARCAFREPIPGPLHMALMRSDAVLARTTGAA